MEIIDDKLVTIPDVRDLPGWNMLTEKQKMFILSYLLNWNTKQAAKEAGVSTVTVYNRWLDNENFKRVFEMAKQAFIAELEEKLYSWVDEKKDTRTLLEILKIRGKKHGWGDNIDIFHNGKIKIEFVNNNSLIDNNPPAGEYNDEVEERR